MRRGPGRAPERRPESYRVAHEIEHADDDDEGIAEIVRRAQAGDDLAFAELYVAFFDRVRRFLVVTIKDPEDATEIAQDAFERAFKMLDRYEPDRAAFRTWVFRIASNMAIDHLRRRRRKESLEPRGPEAEPVALAARSTALIEHLDPDSGLRDLVDALPEAQRRVVTLRFVFDFTTAEIADVLGTTGDAVRHLQHRALKTLGTTLRPAPSASGSIRP